MTKNQTPDGREASMSEAKAIFMAHSGDAYDIWREGDYEKYQRFRVTRRQEKSWATELMTGLLQNLEASESQLERQRITFEIFDVLENYKFRWAIDGLMRYYRSNIDIITKQEGVFLLESSQRLLGQDQASKLGSRAETFLLCLFGGNISFVGMRQRISAFEREILECVKQKAYTAPVFDITNSFALEMLSEENLNRRIEAVEKVLEYIRT